MTDLDVNEVRQVYEIRTLLEVDALRRAFPALTPFSLQRAEAILDQLDSTHESAKWRELDEEFHALLYEQAQRNQLVEMINGYGDR